jgi:radical SAM/Cys-rich protein
MTDRQRGGGVFLKSIEALEQLNSVGYGKEGSGLLLDLVYNPVGAFLPGNQEALEKDFKKALMRDFNISFNHLFTITNLPISRYLEYLIASDNYEDYMEVLLEAFNPNAVKNVMCRNTLSVGWDGSLYDCDFNQMLNLKIGLENNHISNFDEALLQTRDIIVSQHCYGCTAGSGSSCQGAVV